MFFKKMLGSVVNESKFKQDVAMLKDWDYEIIPYKKDRTNEQNRYLRGWVYPPIAEDSGNPVEEVHELMKLKFLRTKTTSWKARYVRSTTTLNTAEFAQYIENIRNWMATFGLYIPTPEEWKRANWLLDDDSE